YTSFRGTIPRALRALEGEGNDGGSALMRGSAIVGRCAVIRRPISRAGVAGRTGFIQRLVGSAVVGGVIGCAMDHGAAAPPVAAAPAPADDDQRDDDDQDADAPAAA